MIEIRDKKLLIDDNVIGDEEKILHAFEKSLKYDELITIFEELKQENLKLKSKNLLLIKRGKTLQDKIDNMTILSEEAQAEAGHLLAKSLLGGK